MNSVLGGRFGGNSWEKMPVGITEVKRGSQRRPDSIMDQCILLFIICESEGGWEGDRGMWVRFVQLHDVTQVYVRKLTGSDKGERRRQIWVQ